MNIAKDLMNAVGSDRFAMILADPPRQFSRCTGKMASEHKWLQRYPTTKLPEIKRLPVEIIQEQIHIVTNNSLLYPLTTANCLL